MGHDTEVESSFFWARLRDIAHREHPQHNRLHRRQDAAATAATAATAPAATASAAPATSAAAETTTADASTSSPSIAVTQITTTVSVIQQANVDTDGHTFAVQTAMGDTTGATIPTIPSSNSTTSTGIQSLTTTPALLFNSSTTDSSTPLTSASYTSLPAVSLNTTASSDSLSSAGSSSSSSYFNGTSSSSTSLSISLSSTSLFTPTTSFTGVSTTSSSTSDDTSASTTTGFAGGFIGGAPGTAGEASAGNPSHKGSDAESGSSSAPSTPVVVGSVCGAVAGAAMVLLLLLFLFRRWKKQHGKTLSLVCAGPAPGTLDEKPSDPPDTSSAKPQHRSLVFAVPAALASLTGYKRASQKTDRTDSTTNSEVGFYRVSGRKLPSVWQHGGAGYGGAVDNHHLSETSFYRDSAGFHGGIGASPTDTRASGIPVMRPSPARTPVTEQGPFIYPPPPRPDALGRSHPSQDGSHVSKFMEEV